MMSILRKEIKAYTCEIGDQYFCPDEDWRNGFPLKERRKVVGLLYRNKRLFSTVEDEKGVWDKCNAKTKCKFIAALARSIWGLERAAALV